MAAGEQNAGEEMRAPDVSLVQSKSVLLENLEFRNATEEETEEDDGEGFSDSEGTALESGAGSKRPSVTAGDISSGYA